MSMEGFPQQESLPAEFIREKVREVQEIHQEAAEKYLPAESPLREQINLFYSDEARLCTELTNVFRGMTIEQVNKALEHAAEELATEAGFLKYIANKDYSTAKKRDERFPNHPYV